MTRRSSAYPRVDLKNILLFVEKLTEKYSEGEISQDEVVEFLGLKSKNSSGFGSKTSTARQYGLINYSNKTITLTESAIKYLHPIDEEDRKVQRIELINRPVLYSKLLQRFSGKVLPTPGVISNLMVRDYGIISSASKKAARIFIDSLKFAEVIDPDSGKVLDGSDMQKEDIEAVSEDKVVQEKRSVGKQNVLQNNDNLSNNEEYFVQTINLMPGKTATLSIPWAYDSEKVEVTMQILESIVNSAKAQFDDKKKLERN
ncbi:hypothetical protein [Lactiplantibacillus xiangfangensis]|uniref:hypothetical protein n=1 Tax=Lactiplantibacillus xiangfangensis TaxID=942150 RepID=UPI00384B2278